MRNVLFITDNIRPGGGPAGYLYNLRNGFDKIKIDGCNVDFYSINNSEERHSSESSSSINGCLKKKLKRYLFDIPSVINHVFFLKKKIDKDIFDIASKYEHVIIHGQNCYFLARELDKKNVPFSIMLHGPTPLCDEGMMDASEKIKKKSCYYYWLKHIDSFLLRKSRYIFSPSLNAMDGYKCHFSELLLPEKMKYIYSGVSNPTVVNSRVVIREQLNVNNSDVLILYAGRFVDHKGFDLYLDCANYLSVPEHSNIKFYCAGDGYLKNRININVVNLGWRKDIHDLINACDLLVVPNRQTYFDLLPIEAAALGCMVISTDVGGNKQLCNILPDLYLTAPSSIELSNKILAIVDNNTNHEYFSSGNRSAYLNQLTDVCMANRWVETIRGLE